MTSLPVVNGLEYYRGEKPSVEYSIFVLIAHVAPSANYKYMTRVIPQTPNQQHQTHVMAEELDRNYQVLNFLSTKCRKQPENPKSLSKLTKFTHTLAEKGLKTLGRRGS